MKRKHWIWMPHPAHHICADRCQFRLATYVGGYIVSTVGEMIASDGKPHEVGLNREYETMVFEAEPSRRSCCPYEITGPELEVEGYNDPGSATRGHMALCEKWAKEE